MSIDLELIGVIHCYMSQPSAARSSSCLLFATDVSSQTLCDSILAARGPEQSTMLYAAATVSDTELVENFLLPLTTEQKLDILSVQTSTLQETVLGFAVRNNCVNMALCILRCLDSNAIYKLLETENKFGWTPVHEAACIADTRPIAAMLNSLKVSQRQNIFSHSNDDGHTPLHLAAYFGRTEMIKDVLDATANNSLFQWAASQISSWASRTVADTESYGQIKVDDTRTMLLTTPNQCGLTVAPVAAGMGHSDFLTHILARLDIKARYKVLSATGESSKTVMHLAAFYGHTATFKALLKLLSSHDHQHGSLSLENGVTIKDQTAGINHLLSNKDADGKTVLNETVCSGYLDMVKALIDSMDTSYIAGMLKACTTSGNTPVHTACWLGKAEMVECMLTAADENQRFDILQMLNVVKQSALHGAALTGHAECIESVLRLVTSVKQQMLLSQRDKNGNIALALAAQNGHTEAVQSLLTKFNALGIDDILLTINLNFQTVMHLAALQGHTNVIVVALDTLDREKLQQLIDTRDKKEMTFLDILLEKCHCEAVDFILKRYLSTEKSAAEENNNDPSTIKSVSTNESVPTGEEWSGSSAMSTDVLEIPTSKDIGVPEKAFFSTRYEAEITHDQSTRPKRALTVRKQQPESNVDHVTKKNLNEHVLKASPPPLAPPLTPPPPLSTPPSSLPPFSLPTSSTTSSSLPPSSPPPSSLPPSSLPPSSTPPSSTPPSSTPPSSTPPSSTPPSSLPPSSLPPSSTTPSSPPPPLLKTEGQISEEQTFLKSDDAVEESQLEMKKYSTTKALEVWKMIVNKSTSWEEVHAQLAKHPYYQQIRRALNETVDNDYMERKDRKERLELTVGRLEQRLEEYEWKLCILQSRVFVNTQGIHNLSLDPGNDADNVNEPKQPIKFNYMLSTSDSDDSGLSDAEEQGYCDHSSSPILQMRMRAVKKQRIKDLYTDEQKVYRMTDKQRGRVLIINIEQFRTRGVLSDERKGSEFDYINLQSLFRDLRFEIASSQPVLTNLTAEEIYREVQEETKNEKHEQMGMFVLVLMSFGIRGDKILDVNKQPVDLVKIYELLSPTNFPAMKGKPRLVIVQACSGEQVHNGAGAAGNSPAISATLAAHCTSDESSPSPDIPKANHDGTTPKGSILLSPTTAKITGCSTFDDLCVMKASSESYLATRSHSHGSWFIRILIATFYKHAHHRDVETLFKIIQDRVRRVSLSHPGAGDIGGNMPTCQCWFTNHKKLYFFPGYPPSGR